MRIVNKNKYKIKCDSEICPKCILKFENLLMLIKNNYR